MEHKSIRTKAAIGRRPSAATPGREMLLRVALRHFSSFGYEGTSLRKLAEEAEVDPALVARLFGSKMQLWLAVVEQLADQISGKRATMDALTLLSRSDARAALEGLIFLLAELSFDSPAVPAFLLHEMNNPSERMSLLVERMLQPLQRACQPVIDSAILAGVVHVRDSNVFFHMLMSAITVPMCSPMLSSNHETLTENLRDHITQEVVRMILGA